MAIERMGVFPALIFTILGLKNMIQFFHIMVEWQNEEMQLVTDFVGVWTLGSFVFDMIFIIIGISIIVYRPKKPKI